MGNNFKNFEEENQKAPDLLKGMIVSEVDFIRDAMQLFGMFFGESFVAAGKLIQGGDSIKNNNSETI